MESRPNEDCYLGPGSEIPEICPMRIDWFWCGGKEEVVGFFDSVGSLWAVPPYDFVRVLADANFMLFQILLDASTCFIQRIRAQVL